MIHGLDELDRFHTVTNTGTGTKDAQLLQKFSVHDRVYRNMHLFHLVMHVTLGSVVPACLSLFGLLFFHEIKLLLAH